MQYKESYFSGRDGSARFFRTWSPDEEPKGLVVISHGYAEHSGRYRAFAQRLLSGGYAVWAHDHYGHGNSAGPRAYIERIELLAEDLVIAVETSRVLHNGLPVFLYGHSMGGSVAALAAASGGFQLSGAVFSAAPVRVSHTIPALTRVFAALLRLVAPATPLLPFHSELLSRSEEVVTAYREDPLTYTGRMKVATGLEITQAEQILDDAVLERVRVPALVLHGGEDRLVPPESSQRLYELLGSSDKTLRLFDRAYHEIHHEECAEQLFSELLSWLDGHL